MRFFRFVIILLSGFLHYHIYHHLAFLCQPIRPHPEPVNKSGHEKYYFLNLIFKSRH